MPNQPRMACCQILSQPLGNASSLDEDMVGMQLALHGLTVSRRFPVQVLIPITPFQRLHRLHPEMVVECPRQKKGKKRTPTLLDSVDVFQSGRSFLVPIPISSNQAALGGLHAGVSSVNLSARQWPTAFLPGNARSRPIRWHRPPGRPKRAPTPTGSHG